LCKLNGSLKSLAGCRNKSNTHSFPSFMILWFFCWRNVNISTRKTFVSHSYDG
jgi:hypothetical protein